MALILAIEPDRKQSAQLATIVRSLGAELILVDTTERALDAIGTEVPDLVLVPALLSPTDDAALAAALRVIATAARVQMLTTPAFAAGSAKPSRRKGVLGALRRERARAPESTGCDPKVFGEQIASYLERVAAERAAAAELEEPFEVDTADLDEPQVIAESEVTSEAAESLFFLPAGDLPPIDPVAEAPVVEEPFAEVPIVEVPVVEVLVVEAPVVEAPVAEVLVAKAPVVEEPVVEVSAAVLPIVTDIPTLEELSLLVEASEPEREDPDESIELADVLDATPDAIADLEFPPLDLMFEASTEQTFTIDEDPMAELLRDFGDEPVLDLPAPPVVKEPDDELEKESEFEAEPEPLTADAALELDELWMPLGAAAARMWPGIEGTPAIRSAEPRAVVQAPSVPQMLAALPQMPPPPVGSSETKTQARVAERKTRRVKGSPRAARTPEPLRTPAAKPGPEWVALIESLRHDVERLRAERRQPPDGPQTPAAPAMSGKRQDRRRRAAAQDEWGFFDPEQCGFAALLAKLDEVTDTDEGRSA